MTEHVAASEAPPPIDADFRKELVRDFRLSFRFSQGDVELQRKLFTFLAATYTSAQRNMILSNSNDLQTGTHSIKIPKQHVDVEESYAELTFDTMWSDFIPIIKNFPSTGIEVEKDDAVYKALENMVLRESTILKAGRSRKNGDPYESFIRKYGIQKSATGSTRFDEFFQRLKQLYEDIMHNKRDSSNSKLRFNLRNDPESVAKTQADLRKLKKMWEEKHPGETFEV